MEHTAAIDQTDKSLNWNTIFFVTLFHILAVVAIFNFSWANLTAAFITWWIAGSFGIGIGYHRLLTHRGFKAPKWLEYTLSVFGTLAMQSGPLTWVTTHRVHHAFTDQPNDPHSPRHGTYWSHMGWIFRGKAQNQSPEDMQRYCPDFANDRFHQWLNNYYYIPVIAAAAILLAVGGWQMVLWGIFLRSVFGWHFTWLVNSATHLWGTRRFETRDDSRNNALVAAVTFGEGWHNNHHAYPRSAKHGLVWYEFDVNWVQIWAWNKLGIIKDVYAYQLEKVRPEPAAEHIDLSPLHETS